MRFVEAVARELRHEIEDHDRVGIFDAALHRAVDEALALRIHLRLDLLAHGAAQQIGFPERIAGERLRDLHHLLLVDDDAVGLLQDRLEQRVEIVDMLLAVLAAIVERDVVHRARAIERDEGDEVLQPVGLHADQRAPHALPFHLEHADRFAARQHGESRRIVEGDRHQVQIDVPAVEELHGMLEHRQRLQAQKVELHQSRLLDPLHVELGDRERRARIAVERHQFLERPVADDDAGGVRRSVAVEPFELHGDRQKAIDDRLLLTRLLEARLALDRLFERDGIGRVGGHQLAEPVDLPVGHFEHASDVAERRARLQRSEGDDLRNPVAAVALLHVGDHLVAPLLAEVDVEVRHRHAVGIEEALEEEPEAKRIEVGDRQRPGDDRAGAGAAPRPDGNAARLRPFDEVGDDQEVARILHRRDDAELELQTLAVVLFFEALRRPVRGEAAREPLLRLPAKLRLLFTLGGLRIGSGRGEARQDWLRRVRTRVAAARDLDGVLQRLGHIAEARDHLRAAGKVMLRRQSAAVVAGKQPPLGD